MRKKSNKNGKKDSREDNIFFKAMDKKIKRYGKRKLKQKRKCGKETNEVKVVYRNTDVIISRKFKLENNL